MIRYMSGEGIVDKKICYIIGGEVKEVDIQIVSFYGVALKRSV